jgi:hypothetical protein
MVGQVRVLKNGTTVVGGAAQSVTGSYAEFTFDNIPVDAPTDTFEVQVSGGQSHVNVAGEDFYSSDECEVDWSSLRASLDLGSFF